MKFKPHFYDCFTEGQCIQGELCDHRPTRPSSNATIVQRDHRPTRPAAIVQRDQPAAIVQRDQPAAIVQRDQPAAIVQRDFQRNSSNQLPSESFIIIPTLIFISNLPKSISVKCIFKSY